MTVLSPPAAPPGPPAPAPPGVCTGLRPGITVQPGPAGLQVGGPATGRLPVRDSPAARCVLHALADRPAEAELAARVVAVAGEPALLGMHLLLARLAAVGFLEHRVVGPEGELARLRVVGSGPTRLGPALPAGRPVRLSRFAAATADGALTVRAPRSPLALDLDPRLAGLLGLLAQWRSPDEIAAELPAGPAAALGPVLRLAACCGLLAPGSPDDDAEAADRPAGQWAAADLWLHAQSRGPRTVSGYGGTYAGRGVREPEPCRTGPRWEPGIDLALPDAAAVARRDPGFSAVLEGRRSRRVHDDAAPITVAQLGELLHRTARLRRSFSDGAGEQVADRPYPSGGAVHELELYPLVTRCAGLEPGLYHYRTDAHRLELVSSAGPELAGLAARARAAAVMAADPQVVLLVSARFGRVMHKYESMAYALVLKHVGVLYQTVYLVGEAMGLAVCALGGGDAEAFATATGLDYLTEGSVGELVLGSRVEGREGAGEDLWRGEAAGAPS